MKLLFVNSASYRDGQLVYVGWIKGIFTSIGEDYEITLYSITDEDVVIKRTPPTAELRALGEPGLITVPPVSPGELMKEADAIVLFGTEKDYTLSMLRLSESLGLLDRTTLFAQGMMTAIARHYTEGLPAKVIRRWTLRDIISRKNIRREARIMDATAKIEDQSLRSTRRFIGRTTMDKAFLRAVNPDAVYYKLNDTLRSCFYEGSWSYGKCVKHRLFVSQYYYPLKGFHYLLEAVAGLKSKYPDIKIAAAGYNPLGDPPFDKSIKDSSYTRYLKTLIREYGLTDNIEPLGRIPEERMKEEYLKANAFVIPSTIENSPNSLAEAMMLGVPCVASDVGGVTDFARHGEEAYIYPSSAVYLLRYYIDKVFSDGEEAEIIGMNGRKRAEKEYDRQANIKTFEGIMRELAGKS